MKRLAIGLAAVRAGAYRPAARGGVREGGSASKEHRRARGLDSDLEARAARVFPDLHVRLQPGAIRHCGEIGLVIPEAGLAQP
ncbi:MAG TPA: hypothetical protein VF203_00460 [Burkholderiales bacterium]